jgi:hypothetical protein
MPQCRITPGRTAREREIFALSATWPHRSSRARQLLNVEHYDEGRHMKVGHMEVGHMDVGDMDECPWR